uniref:Myosin light chain 5 n=1 Tax=Balaenoptera musculus TaxID=9771 RepID=A0A8C0D246_BALMU
MPGRKTKKKEGGALRAQRASSNVFSNFEQTQIQEFKEVRPCSCTGNPSTQKLMPEGSPGKCKTNVKDEELDAMLKEASGPINFTMFLNMFGEKLSGTDAEETILNGPSHSLPPLPGPHNPPNSQVDQMFQFSTIDSAGNLDYKALSYVLTHGKEKE